MSRIRAFLHLLQSLAQMPETRIEVTEDAVYMKLFGQSNVNGQQDDPVILPPGYDEPIENVYILNSRTNNGYETLEYLNNHKDSNDATNENGVGPELFLGVLLRDYFQRPVYFIKKATSSTAIAQFQANTLYNSRIEWYWDVSLRYWEAQNISVRNLGMLWIQGHADQHSTTYADDMATLFQTYRTLYNDPELLVIYRRMNGDQWGSYNIYPSFTQYLATDPNARMIDETGLPLSYYDDPGYVHVNVQGQQFLAQKAFEFIQQRYIPA